MNEQKKIWLVYTMGEEDPLWACLSENDAQSLAETERDERPNAVVWAEPMEITELS